MKTLREYIDQLDEISRRDFLKGAGVAAVSGMTGAYQGTKSQIIKRVGDDFGYFEGFISIPYQRDEGSKEILQILKSVDYNKQKMPSDIRETDYYTYSYGRGAAKYKSLFPNGHTDTPADNAKFIEIAKVLADQFKNSSYYAMSYKSSDVFIPKESEEDLEEEATPDAVARIEQLVKHK
jgi:hypothetical protein